MLSNVCLQQFDKAYAILDGNFLCYVQLVIIYSNHKCSREHEVIYFTLAF